jgi:hypothetical protein
MEADREALLKNLAALGRALGYNEHRVIHDIAEFSVHCQMSFNLSQKETMKLIWHLLGTEDEPS